MAKALTTATLGFLQDIVAESETVQEFVETLKLEQNSLSSGTTEDLPGFAEKKSRLAVRLSEFAGRRNGFLSAQGFPADRRGIEGWCAGHPENKDVANAWSRILALASEARELNRLNGELIAMRMQHNAKALEALQAGNKPLDLYGPDGLSTPLGNKRIIDSV